MGEVKVYFHAFLTSKLEESGWSNNPAVIVLEKYPFVPMKQDGLYRHHRQS
jgi:hypothetical protein